MEFSITTMIVLSIILMAAGVLLLLLWPVISASKDQSQGQSVTVKGTSGSIVTVRNAAGGDFSVIFDNSSQSASEQVVPASVVSDRAAEEEVTIIDELKDPRTSAQRKKAIEDELLSLGYRIVGRKPSEPTTLGKPDSQKPGETRPQEKPASTKPSESDDSADSSSKGVDEGLGEQEPQFDDFYDPSKSTR